MSVWHYVSVDAAGKLRQGLVDGNSSQEIRQKLQEIGQTLIELVPEKSGNISRFHLNHSVVSRSTLALLTFQIGMLLSAGLTLVSVLKDTADLAENPTLKTALFTIRTRVLEGHSLAAGMNEFPDIFPELYRATIAAGERTGHLDEIAVKLAHLLERQEYIRHKIQQALIYPALLSIVSVVIVGYLLTTTLPTITKTFTDSGQTLPGVTQSLLNLCNWLRSYGIYLILILTALFFYARHLLKSARYRFVFHRLLLKIPILGEFITITNAARYSETLGILFTAGLPITEAMQTAGTVITLLPMKAALTNAASDVALGLSVHQALQQTGYFTKMSTQLIAGGEASGQLSIMLEKSANYQDQQIARRITAWLTLFEPIMILLMGLIVLFIVLAALLPVFQMNDFISQA